MQQPRIIFFGTPEFVIPILKKLQENYTIVGVVTAKEAPVGRKQIITPSPISLFTKENLPEAMLFSPEKLETIAQDLETLKPDLFVVAAYGKIISDKILSIPTHGSLNIHPSLLPKYRGPSPIQSALLHNEKKNGISIIEMDKEMDHGPIVFQEDFTFSDTDTFATLQNSMFKKAAESLPTVINDFINKTTKATPQIETDATYCEKITKETGYIDSKTPPSPEQIDRMIRALYPWPTAWTRLLINGESKIIKLLPMDMIQVEGKNEMKRKDFYNGYPMLKAQLEELLLPL